MKPFNSFYFGLYPGISLGSKRLRGRNKDSTQVKAFWCSNDTSDWRFPSGEIFDSTRWPIPATTEWKDGIGWGNSSWSIWRKELGFRVWLRLNSPLFPLLASNFRSVFNYQKLYHLLQNEIIARFMIDMNPKWELDKMFINYKMPQTVLL